MYNRLTSWYVITLMCCLIALVLTLVDFIIEGYWVWVIGLISYRISLYCPERPMKYLWVDIVSLMILFVRLVAAFTTGFLLLGSLAIAYYFTFKGLQLNAESLTTALLTTGLAFIGYNLYRIGLAIDGSLQHYAVRRC